MIESPVHYILNEIRVNFSNVSVTIIDIRKIEYKYKISSILNIKENNKVVLRITSFSLKGVNFEDISIDMAGIEPNKFGQEKYFLIQKYIYEIAYGVKLVDNSETLIDLNDISDLSYDDFETRLSALEKRLDEIELESKGQNKSQNLTLF
jgi:hypothetical protein